MSKGNFYIYAYVIIDFDRQRKELLYLCIPKAYMKLLLKFCNAKCC
jgi:hypothetical protein